MTVTLPENISALQKMSESEIKLELALSLYTARKVTIIQAADIAGIGFFEFQELLRDRKIPQHYDVQDLEDDLQTLRELKNR
jgi:predicted HTH domain antitoxin